MQIAISLSTSKKINAAEICPVVELAARTAGPAVPDPNASTSTPQA